MEIEDLGVLVNTICGIECGIGVLDKFYVGYKIPQIGKEFDLLRFGKESIINIELKNSSTNENIEKQLLRNNYYLNFIEKKVYTFTFVSSSRNLYFLKDGKQLEIGSPDYLLELIANQEVEGAEIPDLLFDPLDYLVSPFNLTEKFLAGEYFLTHQQEEVKNKVIALIKIPKEVKFISITGSAGTGKTLLTYDIVRYLIKDNRKALIIHCGQLNDGHEKLKENDWRITSIKRYKTYDLADFDLVIIDEAQRIYQGQLNDIVERVRLAKCGCIFSYDKIQTLSNWEEKNNIAGEIESINSIIRYKLSEKIRTNKEIATFIKMLFNNRKSSQASSNGNIEINFFNNTEDAKNYLERLKSSKWEVLRFTPSQYNKEYHNQYFDTWSKTSHQVIGQEFDGVAVVIDQFFTYDTNGDLVYKRDAYYAPTKILFQNITRARKKLNLVIIGNEELLKRCINILQ
ncbi:hypothetical protein W03_01540 [Nitrosomonas sp. PY1]|nr:hypothetical protein W03_01540 [Nitrosomonas sp. PY1]